MDLWQILRSGQVRRWHANPDMASTAETNAAHQWAVAVIMMAIRPDAAPALLRACLLHDVGEVVGDLPGDFKAANPAVAEAHAAAEAEARIAMGASYWLSDDETRWLKLADRVAAWWWVACERPHLLSGGGWPEALVWIVREAQSLKSATVLRLVEVVGAKVGSRAGSFDGFMHLAPPDRPGMEPTPPGGSAAAGRAEHMAATIGEAAA